MLVLFHLTSSLCRGVHIINGRKLKLGLPNRGTNDRNLTSFTQIDEFMSPRICSTTLENSQCTGRVSVWVPSRYKLWAITRTWNLTAPPSKWKLLFQLLTVWTSIALLLFNRNFRDWIQSPSSGKKPTYLGPIDTARPFLQPPCLGQLGLSTGFFLRTETGVQSLKCFF